MTWQEEMNRKAARIAFDGERGWVWEHRDDDEVTVDTSWQRAYRYSEYTAEGAEFQFNVTVRRADWSDQMSRWFENEEATEFWLKLMADG